MPRARRERLAMSESLFSNRPSSSHCCMCYSSMSIGRWGLERKTNVHPSPITTNETMTVILINQWWWSYSSIDYSQGTVDTQTLKKALGPREKRGKNAFRMPAQKNSLTLSEKPAKPMIDWWSFFPFCDSPNVSVCEKGNRILKREEKREHLREEEKMICKRVSPVECAFGLSMDIPSSIIEGKRKGWNPNYHYRWSLSSTRCVWVVDDDHPWPDATLKLTDTHTLIFSFLFHFLESLVWSFSPSSLMSFYLSLRLKDEERWRFSFWQTVGQDIRWEDTLIVVKWESFFLSSSRIIIVRLTLMRREAMTLRDRRGWGCGRWLEMRDKEMRQQEEQQQKIYNKVRSCVTC